MLRPPSLQHEYTLIFSGDPALVLPEDPEERANALRVARETGKWDALIQAGQQPTMFHVRPLPQSTFRWLIGEATRRNLQGFEMTILALRLALRRIDNFGTHSGKVQLEKNDEQQLAKIDVIDALFNVDPDDVDVGRRVVDELGTEILRRAGDGISPKR